MAGGSAQGTTFQFAGTSYTVTRVTVQQSRQIGQRRKISTAHLGTSVDDKEPYVYGFYPWDEDDEKTVEIEYLGSGVIAVGSSGAVSTSLGGGGTGTCVASSITATVGDLIRGNATFRIA